MIRALADVFCAEVAFEYVVTVSSSLADVPLRHITAACQEIATSESRMPRPVGIITAARRHYGREIEASGGKPWQEPTPPGERMQSDDLAQVFFEATGRRLYPEPKREN